MTDNLEKMTRSELWNELASKYSELFNYKTDFVTRYPRSKSECIKLVEFLRLQLTIIEASKTKKISFTGIAKTNSASRYLVKKANYCLMQFKRDVFDAALTKYLVFDAVVEIVILEASLLEIKDFAKDALSEKTRTVWDKLHHCLYSQLTGSEYSFFTRLFLTTKPNWGITPELKPGLIQGFKRLNNPVKLITFVLFRLSIDWLKCYICCLAESLIDHLNGNTGGWNDRQLLLPSSYRYKKVSLCEEMEIWYKYQDFELTQEDQPIFQRIIQAV